VTETGIWLATGAVAGLVGGLWLLARGMGAWQRAGRLADTATSPIRSIAVGEVRLSGRAEPAELLLSAPVTSRAAIYYRARIRPAGEDGGDDPATLTEERAVGFRLRDATGSVRVFAGCATWDVPTRLSESDDVFGGPPPGVQLRDGPAIQAASPDRDQLVAQLLRVRPFAGGLTGRERFLSGGRRPRLSYDEARVEPGDVVTIVGTAMPFEELPDPSGADLGLDLGAGGSLAALDDPEIAADLAAARAAGTLETSAEEAWGNAAIPGFGIGRPSRPPELEPDAVAPAVADRETAEGFARTIDIGPREVVVAPAPDRPLLISLGEPAVAIGRSQGRFLLGLGGAVLAIGSAVALAAVLSGAIP
jgi:hypothetical protein